MANQWIKKEVQLLCHYLNNELNEEICSQLFPNRTYEAVRTKRRQLRKQLGGWGEQHSDNKIALLKKVLKMYSPNHIIEAFGGNGTLSNIYISNSKSLNICERNLDCFQALKEKFKNHKNVTISNNRADKFLYEIYLNRNRTKYNWIDLDPFGSCMNLLPTAVDILTNGYIYFTLSDLHQLRFSKINSIYWRMLIPDTIINNDIYKQLSVLLGSLIFDLSKRFIWNGNMYLKNPKLISPVKIQDLGNRNTRLFRVLLKVETAQNVKSVEEHIWNKLQLFTYNNYPVFNLQNSLCQIDQD